MELKNRKNVLLLMPRHASIEVMIINNLESLGYNVFYFHDESFRYESFGQRFENFLRKTFLGQKDYKGKLILKHREDKFQEQVYTSEKTFEFALVIRPDMYGENIPKLLKNICKKTIAYQWDGFSKFKLSDTIIESYDTFAVFDAEDFDKFSSKFQNLSLTQNFYFDNMPVKDNKEYDFYYIGTLEDERLQILTAISTLTRNHYNNSFKLFNYKRIDYKKTDENIEISNREMSYKDMLQESSKAKILIDIKNPHHTGLSLRFFEALYQKQKVITNNASIKNMDFYHENNHFIFDDIHALSLEDVKWFASQPYYQYEDSIIKKYSFGNWVNRLITI